MSDNKKTKDLSLKALLEKGDVKNFLSSTLKGEEIEVKREQTQVLKSFARLSDMVTQHAKGVFVEEISEQMSESLAPLFEGLETDINTKLSSIEKDLESLSTAQSDKSKAELLTRINTGLAEIESNVTKQMTAEMRSTLAKAMSTLSDEAKLTEDEIEDIITNAALSVESQMPELIQAWMSDQEISVEKIKGFTEAVKKLVPNFDISKATIQWGQIKGAPNMGGGGKNAIKWLADVDIDGIADGEALIWNAATGKFKPGTAGGGAIEGTAVLSTGETVGKVLQADGDDTCSWVTLPGGGDALTTNPLSQFAATTSAQLAGVISDETGTGALVFANSPTLVTPNLGTPSALVGTNITSLGAGAGALLDSEVTNLAQVKAFDSSDYATAAQGATADTALQNVVEDTTPQLGGTLDLNGNDITDTGATARAITKTGAGSLTVSAAAGGLTLSTTAGNGNVTVSAHGTGTVTVAGRDVATDGTKLDGIEASADVTDTANVTAAGALMDSEVDADIKTLALPANTTISAFGATLVDDADAATALTTLGLTATAAELNLLDGITTLSGSNTGDEAAASTTVAGVVELATDAEFTTGTDTTRYVTADQVQGVTQTMENKRITKRTGTTTSSSSLTIASDDVDRYTVTALAAAMTINAPTGTPTDGQTLVIRIKDNATARALTWNAIFRAIGVTLPTTTVISKTMYIGCMYNTADTKWDVTAVAEEA